ncbi:hypothetical protein FRC09_007232 [Ceratobasidium sp. 395]|nr:hypothetical protein FRC09_007232 [Ceratobasidium sp. 395]
MKIHPVFHINLLSPFTEDTDFHRKQVRPPPVITKEGKEEYEVEKIVAWDQQKNGLYYQIRWKGYDPHEDTMERAKKIAELSNVMKDFLLTHPGAPVPKNYKPNSKGYKRTSGQTGNLSTSNSSQSTTTTTHKTFFTKPPLSQWPPSVLHTLAWPALSPPPTSAQSRSVSPMVRDPLIMLSARASSNGLTELKKLTQLYLQLPPSPNAATCGALPLLETMPGSLIPRRNSTTSPCSSDGEGTGRV